MKKKDEQADLPVGALEAIEGAGYEQQEKFLERQSKKDQA